MLGILFNIVRYLPAIAWLGVAGVGAYSYITLSDLGDFTPKGERRNWLDKSVPYLFILLIPFGLKCALAEYREARASTPLKNAAAENNRKLRRRQADLKRANHFPLDPEMREGLLENLNTLRASGMIRSGEVEDDAFLTVAETLYLDDSDLQGTVMVLSIYTGTYGPLANACIFPIEANLPDSLVSEVIQGFAALAGCSADLGPITFRSSASGPQKKMAQFTVHGVEHTVPYMRPIQEPLMFYESIAECFPVDPPFAAADLDSIFLLTRLSEADCAKLNAEFDLDFETFQRLGHETFTSGAPLS